MRRDKGEGTIWFNEKRISGLQDIIFTMKKINQLEKVFMVKQKKKFRNN